MFNLDELMDKISVLEVAFNNAPDYKPAKPAFDLKSNVCKDINNACLELGIAPVPSINDQTVFNRKYFEYLRASACVCTFFKVKQLDPSNKEAQYTLLKMAESHGHYFLVLSQFYKDKFEEVTLLKARGDFDVDAVYRQCKLEINHYFGLDTGKGRFLDLLMNIHIRSRPTTYNASDYIRVSLARFEDSLNDPKTRTEFELLFKEYSGLVSCTSVNDFIHDTRVGFITNNAELHRVAEHRQRTGW